MNVVISLRYKKKLMVVTQLWVFLQLKNVQNVKEVFIKMVDVIIWLVNVNLNFVGFVIKIIKNIRNFNVLLMLL